MPRDALIPILTGAGVDLGQPMVATVHGVDQGLSRRFDIRDPTLLRSVTAAPVSQPLEHTPSASEGYRP